jgi:hypothetical protein
MRGHETKLNRQIQSNLPVSRPHFSRRRIVFSQGGLAAKNHKRRKRKIAFGFCAFCAFLRQ